MEKLIIKTLMITVLLTTIHCYPQHVPKNISPSEANHSTTFEDSVESFEGIVKEVEGMLRDNPKLPRLTKGEILDLLENLTKSETVNTIFDESSSPSGTNNDVEFRDPKAIMMVLPFTPSAESENNVDLYMKPPITKIIDQHQLQDQKAVKELRPIENYKVKPRLTTEPISTTTTSTSTSSSTPKLRSLVRKPQHYRRKVTNISTTTTPAASSLTTSRRHKINTTQNFYNHRYEYAPNTESLTNSIPTPSPSEALKLVKSPDLHPKNINEELFSIKDADSSSFVEQDTPASLVSLNNIDLFVPENLKDVSDVVQNLSPDMKDLLINYGLIPNSIRPKPISESQSYEYDIQEKAKVVPESYVGFKRFPEDNNSDKEMQELLTYFGLENNPREQKSLRIKDQKSVVEMIPYDYQNILKDIEIGDPLETAASQIIVRDVSSPGNEVYTTDEGIENLNKLSSSIDQLENGNYSLSYADRETIDAKSLGGLAETLNKSYSNDLGKPLYGEDGLDLENSGFTIKNEKKREDRSSNEKSVSRIETKKIIDNTTNAIIINETITTETSTIPQGESTTETPSIKDLEDSFGGLQNEENTPAPPPPTPDTGFYYLLDWNTFLDIDDQKGRRVNLRFQPKVGNPMKFLHISVP
ncbi:uncharacterized protein LOC130443976 [Diorhabda sublineata]|uniref:uncharacterized protein LOC130443976 n=1 Tax=Diorhabda sublineata TaxID=1163346 RepID=UPI0024E0E3FF|nr:uncharacterized protein LOC130443976 [Diorhabda sublineata]